ncbi:MAG: 3D domain-containing protein [Acidobacteria bacterium]|nr:3D domain-containing protein [Acidobacteriota bacterium]
MLKSLFGGGAVLTAALLLCSLTFYSQTLIAGNSPTAQNPQTTNNQTINTVSHESGLLSGSLAAVLPVIAIAGVAREAEASPTATAPATSPNAKTGAESLVPESAQRFTATAYALPGRTASGQPVRRGLIAADHSLPLGTRVRLDAGHYSGEYVVADRGGRVRGRIIDIWVPSNGEAIRFGRRPVKLTILSYGAKKARRARKTG